MHFHSISPNFPHRTHQTTHISFFTWVAFPAMNSKLAHEHRIFLPSPKERNSSFNFQPIHFSGVNSLLGAGNLHSVFCPTTWRIIPSGQSPPILSHLGHLKGKQPYLRDLLTMVINHLVTDPPTILPLQNVETIGTSVKSSLKCK